MPPVGIEHTIPSGERPQTYNLDRAATETDQEGHNNAIIRKNRLLHIMWNIFKPYQYTVIKYNFISQNKICKKTGNLRVTEHCGAFAYYFCLQRHPKA